MTIRASWRRLLVFSSLALVLVLASCAGTPAAPTAAPAKPTEAPKPTAAATSPAATTAPTTAPATTAPTAAPTAAPTTAPATSAAATKPAAAASPAVSPAATGAAAKPAAGSVLLTITDGSEARYKAREQLASMNLPQDVVGTTNAVTGAIALSPTGTIDSTRSKIAVDLRSLKTNQSRRDQFIQGANVLNTAQFPNAEFTVKEAKGLPTSLPTSGEATFQLMGDMTVRGVTKPVTWDVTAKFGPQDVTGLATTSMTLADFNIAKPIVGQVLSIDDKMTFELDFKATRATG